LSAEGEPNGSYEWEFYNPIAKRHYLCHDKAIRWIDGRMVRFELAQDVTEAKKNEKERENLILQLGEAIGEIKRLQGILPICSYCKKIRNDEGAWNQLEEYICKHSNAEFTHGICPDCFEKLKDELD
jgi:hypothetical protein